MVWPGPELRVRMGLHLGETEERGGDYFGPTVDTCARIESAGHGGQILVSGAVRAVVDRDELSELGSHRLRDVPDDIHLFQVGDGSFPPLRGLVGVRDTLPTRRDQCDGEDDGGADQPVAGPGE